MKKLKSKTLLTIFLFIVIVIILSRNHSISRYETTSNISYVTGYTGDDYKTIMPTTGPVKRPPPAGGDVTNGERQKKPKVPRPTRDPDARPIYGKKN
jgi:hypothetical protein